MQFGTLAPFVLVLISVYVSLAAWLYTSQRKFLYAPDARRPDSSAVGISSLSAVELATPDGLKLLAWYLPPPEGKPVVVFFHGNAGNVQDRAHRIKDFGAGGYGVFMPEYRGYGGNTGTPTESELFADAKVAIDFLKQQGVDTRRVVVYGESLGTAVAVHVAATHPVAALILEAPFTSIRAIAERRFSMFPVRLMLKDHFDSLSRIGKVNAPTLVLHGARDQVVPMTLGQELFNAAPGPKELWTVENGAHSNLMDHGAGPVVMDFLRRRIF